MIDIKEVKSAAINHWPSIASRVIGIGDDFLSTAHGPCPRCGGNKPWRVFDDFSETGGAICNHCGKFADGVALAQWYCGLSFTDALQKIAEFLGVKEQPGKGLAKTKSKKDRAAPDRDLEFRPWNENLVRLWCAKKPPITVDAVRTLGGRLAKYRKRYNVIAFPACSTPGSQPTAWCIYELMGQKLPIFAKGKREPIEWAKLKITAGSDAGWFGVQSDLSQ